MPKLILGDRAAGKTEYLIRWILSEADESTPILVIPGQRREHMTLFKSRLFQHLEEPRALSFHTPYSLRREAIQNFWPLMFKKEPLFLGMASSLSLLKRFCAQSDFFKDQVLDRHLFRYMMSRSRLKGANLYSDEEFNERSRLLESSPQAKEANQMLSDFHTWLEAQTPVLLDYALQHQVFHRLIEMPEVKQYYQAQNQIWLIENYEELAFSEQRAFRTLSQDRLILTANPYGGITEHLGAHPKAVSLLKGESAWEVHELPSAPAGLAVKVYDTLTTQSLEFPNVSFPIQHSVNYSDMLNAVVQKTNDLIQEGVAPSQIHLITWHIHEQMALQMESRFKSIGLDLDVFRGSMVIQRNPGVNTLVALLRLILWNELKDEPLIPKLTGYEMSQILVIAGQVAPHTAAALRHQFKNQMNQWGAYLKKRSESSPVLGNLQFWVQELRSNRKAYPTLLSMAQALWHQVLLPSPLLQNLWVRESVTTFFQTLSEYEQIQVALPQENFTKLFLTQVLNEDIFEFPDLSERLLSPRLKLMTLHRLCEYQLSSQHQIWIDLKSPYWMKSSSHPFLNTEVLNRGWPIEQAWSMELDELGMESKLARMMRKGLLSASETPFFYSSSADLLGKRQRFERLAQIIRA